MRKLAFTDKSVAALEPRDKRFAYPDPEQRGHYIRVTPNGQKSFVAVASNPYGKQIWATIGGTDVLKIEEAREKARAAIRRIRDGLPAFEEPTTKPQTFKDVAEQWLKRHVQAKGLRSESELRRFLMQYIYPAWEHRPFLAIRRTDVATLLDHIEDTYGARAADHVLATVRGIANWYAARSDDYMSPVTRGMRRWNQTEQARNRVLSDEELTAVWKAAEANGTFGAFIRLALLTAQRRDKVAAMRWADVSVDGVWTIPSEAREKGTAGELKLPLLALDIIRKQPRLGENPHVLAGRGNAAINGFSKAKLAFDGKLPPGIPPWTIHDLRRSARSLMSRAGVASEIAERVLGHTIPGVEGIYDRHEYFDEKADALARLAALIEGIVNPRGDVVVPIGTKRKAKRKPSA